MISRRDTQTTRGQPTRRRQEDRGRSPTSARTAAVVSCCCLQRSCKNSASILETRRTNRDSEATSTNRGRFNSLANTSSQRWVHHLMRRKQDSIANEFEKLCVEESRTLHSTVSRTHKEKWRYANIECWDETRVKLPKNPDFIHASYVDGFRQLRDYICTQGPLPTTTEDFWLMVWKENVVVIGMLCQLNEDGKEKCANYYPCRLRQSLRIGQFHLYNERQQKQTLVKNPYTFVLSALKVSYRGETRKVNHVHHQHWPDRKSPATGLHCIEFIKKLHQQRTLMTNLNKIPQRQSPIVVHCSAGIGRTGTLVVIAVCAEIVDDRGKIDVEGAVRAIRRQRKHAMQTAEQYLFIHKTLLEYLSQIQPHKYAQYYRKFSTEFDSVYSKGSAY